MIDCLLTLVLPCYIYHKKSLHGHKEKVSQSYHIRRHQLDEVLRTFKSNPFVLSSFHGSLLLANMKTRESQCIPTLCLIFCTLLQ